MKPFIFLILILRSTKNCTNCGYPFSHDSQTLCPKCGHGLENESIMISGTVSGLIIGDDIDFGLGYNKRVLNEFTDSLKDFADTVNMQIKDKQISQEQLKDINNGINELAKEVEDVKSGQDQIDFVKQTQITSKTISLIRKVIETNPQESVNIATFTPLTPFSKIIGKGIYEMVNAIARKNDTLY